MECSHRRPIHHTRLAVLRRLLAITGDGSAPPGDQFTMRWFLDHAVVDALLDDPQSPLERDAAIFDLKMLLMVPTGSVPGSREAAGRGSGDTHPHSSDARRAERSRPEYERAGTSPATQPRPKVTQGRSRRVHRTDRQRRQSVTAPGPRKRNSCSHLCALLPVTRRPPCSSAPLERVRSWK